VDCILLDNSQKRDYLFIDNIHLNQHGIINGQQLLLKIAIEELKTKRRSETIALLDSGCARTCVDEDFAREQKWPLVKIPKLIRVLYADGSSVESSTIWYSVDLRIWMARSTVSTGALVTRLKTTKVFLGFDWLKVVNPTIDWQTRSVTVDEERTPLQMRSMEEGKPDYEKEFSQVFSEEEFRELPPRRKWDHIIELKEDHQPLRGKCYPLAAKEKEVLRKFITENRQDQQIRESSSPYASPFFFRPKQGTTELWGIQDYRRLNKITVKDRYPLPLIWDIIKSVQGSKVYSKMDLRWGFNNIHIREGDEAKAAFITPMGLYKPLVMQFSLCNALSTFQRMVDEVLAEEKARGHIIIYINDILIHTENLEQNRHWTRKVLTKLKANKLFCQAQKCQFEVEEVEF
jgi:hypothetical protein